MKRIIVLFILTAGLFLNSQEKKTYFFGDLGLPEDYEQTKVNFLKSVPDYQAAVAKLPSAYRSPVTPAKDQKSCGSCWAFACVGVLESRILTAYGVDFYLSEQQQVSCNTDMKGCDGGNANALRYWFTTGPMTEDCTGYCACDGECSDLTNKCGLLPYNTLDYYTLTVSDFDAVKYSIYNDGAAYFRFLVYDDFMNFWNNGTQGEVYHYSGRGEKKGGHAVLVFGWDDAKGAWLCKNSWGKSAGPNKDGTFWISYSDYDALHYGVTSVGLTSSLPPHYRDMNLGARNNKNNVGWRGKGQWLDDVNGDGKADYVYNRAGTHEYWVMTSNGKNFNTDAKWGSRNSNNNVGYGGDGQWLADVNGDGKADYVYNRYKKHEYWVMLSTGTGFNTDAKWGSRNSNNNVGYGGDGQWMTDVDGDGKADYVYNRNKTHEYWVMLSTGSGFKTDTKWGSRNSKNNVGWGGDGQWLTDVNGDGKADYVYNRDNTHEYWVMLSNGSGFKTDTKWGSRNSNNNVGWSGKGQWLTDVNGDGKADYVYCRANSHEYWVMVSTGSGFKTDTKWGSRNSKNNVGWSGKGQWMADVNGDGKADYVYCRAANSHEYWVMVSTGSGFDTDTLWAERNSKNNVGWSGKGQWLTDVNGDGKADYVYNRANSHEYWGILSIL